MVMKEAKDAFDQAWKDMKNDGKIEIRIYEVPGLGDDSVKQLILQDAEQYRASHLEELEEMVKIVDSEETKTNEVEDSQRWRKDLMQKWQLKRTYTDIDEDIVSIITRKCRGNPYLCLDYFKQMLHEGFIEIDNRDGYVYPSEKFMSCVKHDDWSPLVTPQLSKKICSEILSSFLHTKSKKPGYEAALATAVVQLKTASVLGREFSIDALKHISTLPRDSQFNKRVDDAITALEKADLLEIVD